MANPLTPSINRTLEFLGASPNGEYPSNELAVVVVVVVVVVDYDDDDDDDDGDDDNDDDKR